jgi:hypothetical protein
LGNGNFINYRVIKKIDFNDTIIDISTGHYNSFLITNNKLYGTGFLKY